MRSYLSFYQVNAGLRLNLMKNGTNDALYLVNMLKTNIFEQPLFNFYWFEKSMFSWEDGMIQQLQRFKDENQTLYTLISSFETIALILTAFRIVTIRYFIYPFNSFISFHNVKSDILFSLSYLLLVPGHIFKENESFSGFIRRMVSYQKSLY